MHFQRLTAGIAARGDCGAHALAFRGHLREAFAVNERLLRQPSASPWSRWFDTFHDLSLLGIVPDSLARATYGRSLQSDASWADEVPPRLPLNGVALVGTACEPKWLVFDCPCRQQHRIMLNLEASRRPCWRFSIRNGLTVSPSVDYRGDGYRCHYFVKRGRIIWIQDEEDQNE
jgi:hypothetical protein